jgi:hypothetical protein
VICDLSADEGEERRKGSFSVSEFVVLDTGARIILHAERGYTSWISSGDFWTHTTAESIVKSVLTTVLPDDGADEHPWEWWAELAAALGIEVSGDELRRVPYQVVLADQLLRRLAATEHEPGRGLALE